MSCGAPLFVRSLCDLSGTSLGLAHDLVQLQSPCRECGGFRVAAAAVL